jgi:hypothetical protein
VRSTNIALIYLYIYIDIDIDKKSGPSSTEERRFEATTTRFPCGLGGRLVSRAHDERGAGVSTLRGDGVSGGDPGMEEAAEKLFREVKEREHLLKKIHAKMSDQVAKLHMEEAVLRRILHTNASSQPDTASISVRARHQAFQEIREVRDMLFVELGPGFGSDTG